MSNYVLHRIAGKPGSGANGQGETIAEAKESIRQAIELILEDRKEDILCGLPEDAIQEKVQIG